MAFLQLFKSWCAQRKVKNMKKEKSFIEGKALPAYMTVEAVFVMPMVLCILIITIYVAFLLYDRCVFAQDAYVLCLRESIQREEGAPRVDAERIKSNEQRQFGTKYFAVNSLTSEAYAEGRRCIYEGSVRVLPTSFGSDELMPKSIWNATVRASARKTDPPWSIRGFRRKLYVAKNLVTKSN